MRATVSRAARGWALERICLRCAFGLASGKVRLARHVGVVRLGGCRMGRFLGAKVIALATAGVMLFAGTATAQDWTAAKSITLSAHKDRVCRHHRCHTTVRFVGRVSSERRKCRIRQPVQLRRAGGGMLDATTTNHDGRYSFTRRVRHSSSWYTITPLRIYGEHPNQHVCLQAQSPKVHVRIRHR